MSEAVRIKVAPVRKTVTVKASPERAFDIFFTRMGEWWLKSHSLTESGQKSVTIEPRAGGRWYETGQAGEERDWGEVLTWDPPRKVVLAWRLNADWAFDPLFHTEVEVMLTDLGNGQTRIDLTHRFLENHGERGEAVRGPLDSDNGWSGLLAAYAALTAA